MFHFDFLLCIAVSRYRYSIPFFAGIANFTAERGRKTAELRYRRNGQGKFATFRGAGENGPKLLRREFGRPVVTVQAVAFLLHAGRVASALTAKGEIPVRRTCTRV
ncbi:MAG: hypothetical protein DBX90_00850 [Lentisphaerae bacterium]|nr:MAG: hypothetical protein DBX90_00850 [Lentisphaerota bacterium]